MLRPIVILAALAAHASPRPSLMPMPWKIAVNPGRLRIDSGFRVSAAGLPAAAVDRFTARIFRQAGLSAIHLSTANPALTVECRDRAPQWPTLGEDESYQLDVTPEGARLSASTPTGALRGMETFAQLVTPGTEGFEVPAGGTVITSQISAPRATSAKNGLRISLTTSKASSIGAEYAKSNVGVKIIQHL